jgi:hypothetical protein
METKSEKDLSWVGMGELVLRRRNTHEITDADAGPHKRRDSRVMNPHEHVFFLGGRPGVGSQGEKPAVFLEGGQAV